MPITKTIGRCVVCRFKVKRRVWVKINGINGLFYKCKHPSMVNMFYLDAYEFGCWYWKVEK